LHSSSVSVKEEKQKKVRFKRRSRGFGGVEPENANPN
jgi:hypothetical protein